MFSLAVNNEKLRSNIVQYTNAWDKKIMTSSYRHKYIVYITYDIINELEGTYDIINELEECFLHNIIIKFTK